MNIGTLFTSINLWVLFLSTILISFSFFEGGFQFGKYRCRTSSKKKDAPVGSIVVSTFVLLAFILAFTFSMAASHFDARKQAVLEDANEIRSTYGMDGLLPETGREKV